jgi:DNA-binding beta-propeller fold protein YncE
VGPSYHRIHPPGRRCDRFPWRRLRGRHRKQQIAKFSPDGKLLGWRTGSQLQRPTGIAVDGAGDIYVADRQNGRVQKLSPSGKTLGRWGKGGSGLLQFSFRAQDHMNGVALDPHGNLYVADTANNRIKKLSPQGQTLAIWK